MQKLLLFYIVFHSIGLAPLQAQEIDTCYAVAMESFYDVKYEEAYQKMLSCYQSDTSRQDYLEKLAYFSYRNGANHLSKKWYLKLLSNDSSHIAANHYLGIIYEQEEYLPKALKHYLNLIKLDPVNATFWKKTAGIYFKAGLPDEGLPYFQKAHKINPKDLGVIKSLGEYFINKTDLEKATQILNAGLRLDPDNIGLIQLSAKKDYKLGDFTSTSNQLSGLSRKIDLGPYYNQMLGYSFLQIDSVEKAIFHLEKALVENKRPESIHYYLGNAYQKKNEMLYAKHHYEEAIDAGISKNLGIYYKQLAIIYEKDNNNKKAIVFYKKAYQHTSDPEILFLLGINSDLYYKDKTTAINYFTKYASSDHTNGAYKKYAIDRMQYLREVAHFSINKN